MENKKQFGIVIEGVRDPINGQLNYETKDNTTGDTSVIVIHPIPFVPTVENIVDTPESDNLPDNLQYAPLSSAIVPVITSLLLRIRPSKS